MMTKRLKQERREALLAQDMPEAVTLTCDTCDKVASCKYAFDVYNMFGDCLAEKYKESVK